MTIKINMKRKRRSKSLLRPKIRLSSKSIDRVGLLRSKLLPRPRIRLSNKSIDWSGHWKSKSLQRLQTWLSSRGIVVVAKRMSTRKRD